ncbi:ribonuclease H-like domain-containing protein [Tanacetum coccineum]
MSANDKFGLGYGDHRYDGILSYENEVLQSVFMNKESELVNQPLYDSFVTARGMHVVPPRMTGNYMPSGLDVEIDYSQFTYGPKQSQTSESETQTSDFDTCESDCSVEIHEPLHEPTVNEPKVVSQPKVWSDAPIIEEYESDSEDEHVSLPTEEQETPSFANQQVKPPRETVKNQFTHSKNSTVDKKGMAKQAELNNRMTVLTRTGKIPVSNARASGTNNVYTARHNFNTQAVLTNDVRKISIVKPFVNRVRPKTVFNKTHSPFSRPFNNTTALRTNFSYQKVNTAEDYPHRTLQNKGIVDSGCSRHMTGNKAYLAEYQDFNGGPVAFGGSKGYITGKGKIKTGKLDFEDVCFVKELQHFNLFLVSQMCDKKNKNMDIIEFCGSKGIKREYNSARTPQQNGVAERKNMTLIEDARTMLADSFLPNTFWAEAVSTACYVFNRVLVTKPQNKTPYELITGKIPIISYIRPFGCHMTILNTIDHLGKFEGKSDEGFLVRYSQNSKAFRPVRLENQANKTAGPKEANHSAGTQDNIDAGNSEIEAESAQDYFVLPIWSSYTSTVKSSKAKNEGEKPNKNTSLKTNEEPVDQEDQAFLEELKRLKRQEKEANDAAEALRKEFAQDTEDLLLQAGAARATSTNTVNTASTPVSTASPSGGLSYPDLNITDQDDSQIPALEDIYDNPSDGIFTNTSYDDEGAVANFTNLESTMNVSPIPTSRINCIHHSTLILGIRNSSSSKQSKVDAKVSEPMLFICLMGRRQLEQNRFTEIKRMKEVLWLEIRYWKPLGSFYLALTWDFKVLYFPPKIDMKSAFLYGKIDEESGYRRGTIDKTIFIKKDKNDIMLVQVYVDDIIFRSRKRSWCDEFKALMKSVSMRQRLAGKKSLKNQWMQKESVSKQERKPTKAEPTVHIDPAFDELNDDTIDYMETEDAQDVGRTSYVVHEEKESAEKGVSTAQSIVSTDKPEDSTNKLDEGTDKPKVSTDKEEVSTDRPDEGTVDQNEGRSATQTAPTTTNPIIFGDDETIAQVLIIISQNKEKLKEKEKGVELKDLARDEEVARKVKEDWEAEEEVKKLAEEEAIKAALSNEYDFIQAKINVDKIIAKKLQKEEREIYTIEQRAKFLHETIAAQRSFLAQQRSKAIRNKPPLRNQLRNQIMTYLKHIKRSDNSFIAIGSAKDEKVIKETNEQVAEASKKRVKKDDSIKGEIKEEEGTRKRKLGIRKKMKSKKRKFTSKDDES